jgi:hypothetical protein
MFHTFACHDAAYVGPCGKWRPASSLRQGSPRGSRLKSPTRERGGRREGQAAEVDTTIVSASPQCRAVKQRHDIGGGEIDFGGVGTYRRRGRVIVEVLLR